MLKCEACGSTDDVKPTLLCDLCHRCYENLRLEHIWYAAAQRHNMSRDAGCPVPEGTP